MICLDEQNNKLLLLQICGLLNENSNNFVHCLNCEIHDYSVYVQPKCMPLIELSKPITMKIYEID